MTPVIFAVLALALLAFSQKDAIGDVITVNIQQDDFTRWDDLFKKYAQLRDCPWRWLKAICWVESDLGRDESVVAGMEDPGSDDGWSEDGLSRGIMQMTVPTANRARVRPGTTIQDLDNPETCIDCAARYVRELGQFYFAWDQEGVVRGYNGGPGWRSSSQDAQAMTADYYEKFKTKLAAVLAAQPGNEMERG